MKTVDDIHRINLASLVAQVGGIAKLAEKINRSPSQVSQWLNGSLNSATGKPRGMSAASCRQLELSCGKRIGWMDGDHTSKPFEDQEIKLLNNPEFPAIKRVSLRLSAGITGFAIEADSDTDDGILVFRRSWYEKNGFIPEKLVAIRVKGQSMEPGLFEGDTVVINTNDTVPKDGDVFAVNYEGEALIKRLERENGKWYLSSDNPDKARFSRRQCRGVECIIIGRIVHKQSNRI